MRSLVSLVGVFVVMGAVGCGSIVTVNDGQDGEGGDGGDGGEGAGPIIPPNPSQCPSSPIEMYGECFQENLACSYLEEAGCNVTYTCVWGGGCYGDGDDGYGGYGGGCDDYYYWQPTSASCNPPAVDCGLAQSGDVCALPGDYCSSGFECAYEDKYCGDDHVWYVEYWEDECCYDECCYDECWCEPYYCPETPPVHGDYCDPCYDSEYCYYEIESPCGVLEAYAGCSLDYSWMVEQEVCAKPGEPEPG